MSLTSFQLCKNKRILSFKSGWTYRQTRTSLHSISPCTMETGKLSRPLLNNLEQIIRNETFTELMYFTFQHKVINRHLYITSAKSKISILTVLIREAVHPCTGRATQSQNSPSVTFLLFNLTLRSWTIAV